MLPEITSNSTSKSFADTPFSNVSRTALDISLIRGQSTRHGDTIQENISMKKSEDKEVLTLIKKAECLTHLKPKRILILPDQKPFCMTLEFKI